MGGDQDALLQLTFEDHTVFTDGDLFSWIIENVYIFSCTFLDLR